jgi:ABC-2 type transport system ATP-binding protein
MNEIIVTENLCKHYREVRAVESVSLTVGQGEIYGFLGLNGAGKTTTIRMLLGMIRPTSGRVMIRGEKVTSRIRDLWERTGYLVEVPYAYPNLTVTENLDIVRRLRGLDRDSVTRVIERMELKAYAHRKAGKLSLGNAQRLGLAKALIHHPEILILDEPANGLDPQGIHEFRELLKGLAGNNGVTIFISSHILEEIAKIANRIGIIHEGVLISELDQQQLDALSRKSLVIDAVRRDLVKEALAGAGYECVPGPEGALITGDPRAVSRPDEIASLLVGAGCGLTQLSVREEDLESFFLRTIHENKPEK